MEKTSLKFDTGSMLKMLSDTLYDTPMVLLRENLQNAFDAIRMRMRNDSSFHDPLISITIHDNKIEINDNGIGMTKHEVEEYYWTAGKSGKNTPEAKAAGVVGTFGIGAVANFGVCDTLELHTQKIGTTEECISTAHKDRLEAIEIKSIEVENPNFGTRITVTLGAGKQISEKAAIEYLKPYAEYIDMPILVNGKSISCHDYRSEFKDEVIEHFERVQNSINYKFEYQVKFMNLSPMKGKIYIRNIKVNQTAYDGDILLQSGEHVLWGLHNGFGLATIPINSTYNFGGLVNLMELESTAGREVISKDSVANVQRIIYVVEYLYTEILAQKEQADNYREFLQYLNNHFDIHWANNIKIQLANEGKEFITLGSIVGERNKWKYYKGNDNSIPKKYVFSDLEIVILSQDNPRRSIQKKFLERKNIEELEDKITINEKFDFINLDVGYYAIGNTIKKIIREDYLIPDNEVSFADISHGVHIYVEKIKDSVCVYIKKEDGEIANLIEIYKNNFNVFEPLVKDFVRNYIYQQIIPFIPSSKKEGIVALCNMLKRKRETYTIYNEDAEDLKKSFDLYANGKITSEELTSKINRRLKASTQIVNSNSVRSVDEVLPTAHFAHPSENNNTVNNLENKTIPLPPHNKNGSLYKGKIADYR